MPAALNDEIYTLHPLIAGFLLQLLDMLGIVAILAGDPLQVRQKVADEHLLHANNQGDQQWLWARVFEMPAWQTLHDSGRIMYLQLTTQHRFDEAECALIKEASCGGGYLSDEHFGLLQGLGPGFGEDIWSMALFYNIKHVMQHNNEKLAQLKGPQLNIGMAAEVLSSRGQGLAIPPLLRRNLVNVGIGEVRRRLYLSDAHPSLESLRVKPGMPLVVAQSITAEEVQLQSTPGGNRVWSFTGRSHKVDPGAMCVVEDIQPRRAGLLLPANAHVLPSDVCVLVQLYSSTGPFVALPAVNSTVHWLLDHL